VRECVCVVIVGGKRAWEKQIGKFLKIWGNSMLACENIYRLLNIEECLLMLALCFLHFSRILAYKKMKKQIL